MDVAGRDPAGELLEYYLTQVLGTTMATAAVPFGLPRFDYHVASFNLLPGGPPLAALFHPLCVHDPGSLSKTPKAMKIIWVHT